MGLWSAYFFVKLLLHARGDIDFDPWLNLGFAAFAALPPSNPRQRFAKNLLAVPLAMLLLYHDSRLPPLATLSPMYFALSVYHSASWGRAFALLAMVVGYELARRKLRLGTFVFIGILWVAIAPPTRMIEPPGTTQATIAEDRGGTAAALPAQAELDPRSFSPKALDARLAQFYAAQRSQRVRFTPPADDSVPYDILIIHVAALSWDDLRTIQHEQDPLLRRFDIVLSHFNSAASNGAPAAIRLLRGTCGQTPEQQLYERPDPECSAIDALQSVGFEPHWLVNYDPRADGSIASVQRYGEVPEPPESVQGAVLTQLTADGAHVYGDCSVLSHWLARRESSGAARVVLYYNSVSLGDGNRRLGSGPAGSHYGARLAEFSADMNHFLDDLQRSGRHAVVVFIAEHGAALSGNALQMSGVREIPTPAIVHVPAGVILVNAARSVQWRQARIDTPTSYLAVNELLARFVADNPFDKASLNLAPYLASLPQTDLVAENDGITVMQIGRQSMMRSPDGSWSSVAD
jgi:cellulose synthase operon protein YhjU